jgi:tetratricopeptide (TPR) repeat protein
VPEFIVYEPGDEIPKSPVDEAFGALRRGQYEHAIELYQGVPDYERQEKAIGGLAMAFLLLGNPERALAAFLKARETYGPSLTAYWTVGLCLWLVGAREEACQDWHDRYTLQRKGILTHTTDEAGGVILPSLVWWASTHDGLGHWRKPAERELARKWKSKTCQRAPWPGLLAAYLRYKVTEEEVLAATRRPTYPDAEKQYRREALFYVSARRLVDANEPGFHAALEETAGPATERILWSVEYYLARHELGRTGRVVIGE